MGIFNEQSNQGSFSRGIQGAPGIGFRLTADGNYDITGKKLTNVGAPTSNLDAATKKYVDDKSTSGGSSKTSTLTVDSNIDMKDRYRILNLKSPADADEPVTKQYADSTFLDRGGNRGMLVDLIMNNKKIVQLATPTTNTDAATKKYVDDKAFLHLDGTKKMTGNLDMNNKKIFNLSLATSNNDAVNLDYLKRYIIFRDGTNQMTGNLQMNDHQITGLKANPVNAQDATSKNYCDNKFYSIDGSKALTADLNIAGNRIKNLRPPRENSEAATKKYVDDSFAPYLKKDGSVSMTGNLNMGNKKITGLFGPSNLTDAATKHYVDDKVSNSSPDLSDYLEKDGSVTMTGNLNMGNKKIIGLAPPTSNTDAVTKKYVDDLPHSTADFKSDGSVAMTGNLNMGSKKIANLATPTNPKDAVTKKYVDDIPRGGSGDFKSDGSVAMTGNLNMNSKRVINLPTPVDSTDAASVSWVKNQIQHFNVLSSPVFTITPAPAYTTIYFQYQSNKFVATTSRPGQPLVSWKPSSGTYINKMVLNINRSMNLRKVSFVARDSSTGNVDFWISHLHTGLYSLNIHRTFSYDLSGVFLEYITDANSNHPPITTNIYTGKPSAETKVFSKIKFSSPTEFTDTVTAKTPTANTQVATKAYVDRAVAGPAHYSNVFGYIMESAAQWTDEITTRTSFVINRFSNLSPNSGNFHSYNHRVAYFGLNKYSGGYKFKFGLNFYRLASSDYTICLEFLTTDNTIWNKTQISVDHQSSSGLTFHTETVKKLTHTYYYPAGNLNNMYYHRVIVSFTKNSSGRSFFHVTVNIPLSGGTLASYPNQFQKYYIIVYGINGAVGNIDPDKSFDYHTAFDIDSSKVSYNVPIDMKNKAITNIYPDKNTNSAATYGTVSTIKNLILNSFYNNLFEEVWDFKFGNNYVFSSSASSSSSISSTNFNKIKSLQQTSEITFPSKLPTNLMTHGFRNNGFTLDIPLPDNYKNLNFFIVFHFWDNRDFNITRYDAQTNSKLAFLQYRGNNKNVELVTGRQSSTHSSFPTGLNNKKIVIGFKHTSSTVLYVNINNQKVIKKIGFGSVNSRKQKITFYSRDSILSKIMFTSNMSVNIRDILLQEILTDSI